MERSGPCSEAAFRGDIGEQSIAASAISPPRARRSKLQQQSSSGRERSGLEHELN
jgi:hypothetical protein